MPTPRLHVGLSVLQGGLTGYAKKFELLEVKGDPTLPTAKYLARLRREAPAGFHFTLVAGRGLSELASSTPDAALVDATRRAAETLGARWLLLRTPASAGPSARTRAKLGRLCEALKGAATEVAWEPRGMWTDDELAELSHDLGVTLVRDLAEHDAPPAEVVYTRLLALGRNSRIGSGAIERITERLDGVTEAFVVIEGEGGAGVAKRLRASLGQLEAELDEDSAGADGEDDAEVAEGEGGFDDADADDDLEDDE